MLPAMRQCFGLLLQKAEFLQMMRRQTHEMALPSDGYLQSLTNPPGRIRSQARAVTDIEPVDRLHQAADCFLEKIAIAQRVMAEAFRNVRSEPDVGRRKAVFEVNIAVVQAPHGRNRARFA